MMAVMYLCELSSKLLIHDKHLIICKPCPPLSRFTVKPMALVAHYLASAHARKRGHSSPISVDTQAY